MTDSEAMSAALKLAEEAFSADEVPVGCVIVNKEGRIIGSGRNRREELHDATAHAEIEAIKNACLENRNWRLEDCSLYVTLEPCPMCTGAIIAARIPKVVFGARDSATGSCGSVIDLFSERYGHKPAVYANVDSDSSIKLLQRFFSRKRNG